MANNHLKIEASTLTLEFSGEADEIRQGYQTTRELIISCFQEQLASIQAQQTSLDEDSEALYKRRNRTQPMHQLDPAQKNKHAKSWTPPNPDLLSHVTLALYSDLYSKVCVLDRVEFENSIFNRLLHFENINRIYVMHNQKRHFSKYFTIGKVLWRELTPQGKQAVRSEDK